MLVAKQPLYQPSVPARQPRPRPRKHPRSVPIAKADKAMVVVAIMLMGMATFGLVWRFAQINDLDYRITKLEQQIDALQQGNAALTVQLKQQASPSQIERRAMQELEMQWPTQSQIVNVTSGSTPVDD